ncbi:hypothetical protein CEUSTIGMA_g329.t1 [Chlamydomonas eustigma]|uniref:Uncharacterized protein n=1 Tax=Chlamydomonas eustigma TaxID=1157962 RepID=A0A250WPU8_9CHLO|nr:hypothetical protein CEUSTIGMA_g329.t1 [Chlamydomonas eustigma]|eukprot:GAX72874.1 hypothetical protein CEUSTIGMA_g329.t1 [Chlamydomonas eustigma]
MTSHHVDLIKEFLGNRSMSESSKGRKFHNILKASLGQAQGILSRLLPFGVHAFVSAISYGSGICLLQLLGASLRISCANRLLGPCLGAIGVGAASALSGHMSRHAKRQMNEQKNLWQALLSPFWSDIDIQELLLDAFSGIMIFKLYGGSFRRLLPSNLKAAGAHARTCVPVSAGDHANDSQKGLLISIYQRDGCHHCGSKRGIVIGDHIPPTKLVNEVKAQHKAVEASLKHIPDLLRQVFVSKESQCIKQDYYAQCQSCSQAQASLMRHGRRSALVLHKVWLQPPGFTPGILVGLRQCCEDMRTIHTSTGPRSAGNASSSKGQKREGEGRHRRGIWGWTTPIVEEQQPGVDVYCSFEAKGLPATTASNSVEVTVLN